MAGKSKKWKVLFLDDNSKRIRNAFDRWSEGNDLTIVTNVRDCLRFMSREDWDDIYLDHDLGGLDFVDPESPTCAMEIVRYLEKTAWPPEKYKPRIKIHSSNIFAATAMQLRLRAIGFQVERERYEYV